MPELTPRIGIKKPLGNETVTRQSFNENWDIIDSKVETVEGAQAKADAALTIAIAYTDQHEQKSAPHSGHETPAGAQAKANMAEANAKSYASGLVGALTSLLTTAKDNIVNAINEIYNTLTNHANSTAVHGATSAATANRIIIRDASGRAKVAAPSAADDIARKQEVDTVQANLNTHANSKQSHGISGGYYIAKTSRSDQLPAWNDIQGKPDLALASDLVAKNIKIEDAAGNFAATNVEGALNELFTSVSDGKTQLETAITDKGGRVSKAGKVATFDELEDGIRSIPVGDYAIGDTITDSVLRILSGGMGVEIWSKTDERYGRGIAVDSAGNVYVAHDVDSRGKVVRKLNSAGNEIWSKSDVPFGNGIAVDRAGNVYVTHDVDTGEKAVRKLDSAGNEIWSKTDVQRGWGIAVDSAGNVYVTHTVGTGGKAVRKLDSAGNEIWSKTDVPYGRGIAVDSAGNVYVAHNVGTGGKAVRKLNSAGNEIWSKTDVQDGEGIAVDSSGNVYVTHNWNGEKVVRKLNSAGNEIWSNSDMPYGYGIAVDRAGNVYVTHYMSGKKTVRKLDSAGNEIWSKTDVMFGCGIAVDSAGNVYVAHDVDTGRKAVRKLDGNKYFQIVG